MAMKNMFLLPKIHSFIDVITNSSSELFIFKTDKTVDTLKEILKESLDNYNISPNPDNGPNPDFESFETAFGNIFIISEKTSKEDLSEVIKTLMNYSPNHADDYGLDISTYPEHSADSVIDKYDAYYRMETKWVNDNMKNFLKTCKGMAVIYSQTDNSIPWEVQEFIERTFGGHRYHLG